MIAFLRDNWELLSSLFAGAGAVIAYLQNRRRELAWKRTEFLFDLSGRLDNNPDFGEAMRILEGRHETITVDQLFPAFPATPDRAWDAERQKFDRFLNVFHALAYAESTVKTLSIHEVALFGWYLQKICFHEGLRRYCLENGFSDIIEMCERSKLWRKGATPDDLARYPTENLRSEARDVGLKPDLLLRIPGKSRFGKENAHSLGKTNDQRRLDKS